MYSYNECYCNCPTLNSSGCCNIATIVIYSRTEQNGVQDFKISRSQDFIGISGFLWDFNLWISVDFRISMGFMGVLWDYFRILRK